jgi:hypothetical protein
MPGVNALHNSIVERAKSLSCMGEEVPKPYMVLADTIVALAKQKKKESKSKSFSMINCFHIFVGQLVEVSEITNMLPGFVQEMLQRDPHLLTRALKLLHEWAQCVYFDADGLRDIICLSPEFLTQDTLAELFNPKFLHANDLINQGKILNKYFFKLWSDQAFVSEEYVPKLLLFMQLLQMSFTQPEAEKPFDQLTTFIPSLLPTALPSDYDAVWPKTPQSSFPIEKRLAYFFDLLPREFISRLLALLLQEFFDCTPTALWQSGGVFSSPSFKLLVRLEHQPKDYKIVIMDQSLRASKGSASSSKTQLLVVEVRAIDEKAGFQAMQNVFELKKKIQESYIGIRSWRLARECPLHGDACAELVDMTIDPICITTRDYLASTTEKQLSVSCGLKEGDGLIFASIFFSHSSQKRR